MIDSSDVRKTNKNLIRKILWSGGAYTKQTISQLTGLSVATCNTILNELEASGEVTGKKERLHNVGRSTILYSINESYEAILCLEFRFIKGIRSLSYSVLTTTGYTMDHQKTEYPKIDYEIIYQTIKKVYEKHPLITIISIAPPSIADSGIIRHCDLPELENLPLKEKLTEHFSIPIIMENDMYFKAYGFFKKECTGEDIVSLVNFPALVLPGTATIAAGNIIKGTQNFAGMVGFLPFGIARDKVLEQLVPKTYFPYAVQSVASIIVLYNPKVILFTGDLLNKEEIEKIRNACEVTIPPEYIPEFIFIKNTDSYLYEGMLQRALDEKGGI